MKNSDFVYKYQYQIFHQDNDESRKNDIDRDIGFLKTHNILHPNKNAKILELGCGMGRLMLALKSFGYNNVTGIDIDKGQIAVAKREKLNVILGDVIKFLKTNNDVFDAIYCLDVVEHIEKNQQLILFKLLNKHLSKTGFIVIRVPNALAPCAPYSRYMDFTHQLLFTDTSINFLANNSGFSFAVTRPEFKEIKCVRRIKSMWYRMYKRDWCMKNPILTYNIVSILFKDEKTYKDYMENTPVIKNRYWRI